MDGLGGLRSVLGTAPHALKPGDFICMPVGVGLDSRRALEALTALSRGDARRVQGGNATVLARTRSLPEK